MNETNELIARIESLERQNRRWMRIGAAALVAIAGAGVMSMRPACNSVSAERFVLLDGQGHQRALLTAYETGGAPQLALYDKKGRAVATLGVEKTGAFLALADANAEKSVRYGVGCASSNGDACGKPGDGGNKTEAGKSGDETKSSGSTMAQEELR
jgi:hypothetical protein